MVAGSPVEPYWQGAKDQVFHSSLTINDVQVLMGSDMIDQSGYTKGNNIAIAMSCKSEAEIHILFNSLSKEGKVLQALKGEFWGATFGSLEDQFGIRWMLNYNKEKQ